MKNFCPLHFLAAALLLAAPASLPAASSHRRHKPAPTPDEDQATPSPSPSPAAPRKKSAPDPDEAPSPSPSPTSSHSAPGAAATSSIETSELQDFDAQPEPIRHLLTAALDLTKRNLTYAYGSADPAGGGMDCSGTVSYLLKAQGFEGVPRDASEQYMWVRKQARVYAVLSKKGENAELDELRPGDLMFWTGTYNIDRDPPVTHTMIYLGKRKKDGKRLMFGASDGRPYDGQKRNGVSVFDFKMPAARSADKADATTAAAPDQSPDFAGYGPIPGIADRNDEAARRAPQERASTGGGERSSTQRRKDAEDSPRKTKGEP